MSKSLALMGLLARAATALQPNTSAAAAARLPRATPPLRHLVARSASGVTEEERFLFDLEGYLVVKNVFTREEVAAANAAVDRHRDALLERRGALRNTKNGTSLAGDGETGRKDMGGMLGWEAGDRDFFRDVLAHPRLVPYLHTFLGHGYRMDHFPLMIEQVKGAEGFHLHGGPIDAAGNPDFFLQYTVQQGTIRNTLLAATVQLSDVGPGDGGFCVLRGSHKANFKVPEQIMHGEAFADRLYQPVTEAGDVVLFSEATTHGSLAWGAESPRRGVIYRFAPANIAYSRSYAPWPPEVLDGLTDAQRAVLEPPYNNRLDRPFLEKAQPDAAEPFDVKVTSRAGAKKDFDRAVFGSTYF